MTITQQWMEQRETVQITGGEVVLRPYDITVLLDEGGHILNPLTGKVKALIDEREAKGKVAIPWGDMIDQLQNLPELRKMLNNLLKKVVMEPNLDEFDVDRFTIRQKGEIFTYMLGGKAALDQVSKFLHQQIAGLATVQPSTEIQQSPIFAVSNPPSNTELPN